jgi:hypothetical protein
VDRVVDSFERSLAAHDGNGACRMLTAPVRDAVTKQEHEPCDRAVLKVGLSPQRRRAGTSVYLTSGFARTGSNGAVFLDHTRDGWRVSAAGCTPTGERLPYDCILED